MFQCLIGKVTKSDPVLSPVFALPDKILEKAVLFVDFMRFPYLRKKLVQKRVLLVFHFFLIS